MSVRTVHEGRIRILVVDEENALTTRLVDALSCCGYQAEAAVEGIIALRMLDRRPSHVLISALRIPDMHGEDLMHLARQTDPDLCVLLIARPGETIRAVECLKAGANDFVTRPYELMDVVVRLRLMLERRQTTIENRSMRATLDARDGDGQSESWNLTQDSLAAFISALESKDAFTNNHSARVSELAAMIAGRLKSGNDEFQTEVRFAGLLHDIGKIGIRESVINKPGALTPLELAEIQRHPVIGETILRPLIANPEILAIVRNHHERCDARGYPDGLAGPNIPLGARIVAVADAYDAMTSARPFRVGMSRERAVEIIREGAGAQWDGAVVTIFLSLVDAGLIPKWSRRTSRRERALPTASDILLPTEQLLKNAG